MTVIMVHKHDRHDHGAAWLLAQKAFYILTLLYIHYHDNKKKGMKQEQGSQKELSSSDSEHVISCDLVMTMS